MTKSEYSYDDVYVIIARYCPSMMAYYADGWCRWPVGYEAEMILAELQRQAAWWQKRSTGEEAVRLLTAAKDAIQSHWQAGNA